MESTDINVDEYYREATPALFNIFIHQCERNMLKASSSLSDALHDDFAATFPLIDAMPQLYAFEYYLAIPPFTTPAPEQGVRPQDLWREPADPCPLPLSPPPPSHSLPNNSELDITMSDCMLSSYDQTLLTANTELSTPSTPSLTTASTGDMDSEAEWAPSVPSSPPPKRRVQEIRSRDELSKPYDKLKTQKKPSAVAQRSLEAAGILICPVNDPLHRNHLGHLCCPSTDFPDISRYNWAPYIKAVVKGREYKAKFDPEVIAAVLECPPDSNGPRVCPFIATGCDVHANADKTLWARHIKTHSTAKAWICDRCDASLSRADALQMHKKDTCQIWDL